jgi:predicted metal-dependent peptidase
VISPKLSAARVKVMEKMPYLGACLWKLRIVQVPDAQWPRQTEFEICVTERGTVLVKDALVVRCQAEELGAALAHEAMHVLLDHGRRRGCRVPMAWNIASDAAINHDLFSIRDNRGELVWPRLPYDRDQVILPETLGGRPGLSAEEYYDLIKIVRVEACCGTGAGNAHAAEHGLDESDAPDPVEWEATRIATASAVRAAGRGNAPGGLRRWADAALTPSPIDWRRALAGATRSALRRAGAWDFDRSRPSRRTDACPGLALPAMRAPHLRAFVIVDTSGSRSQEDLEDDLADVQGILRAAGAEVEVVSCDARVQAKGRVLTAAGAGRLLAGGGGTDMRPGFEAALASRPRADVVVCLTDGEVFNGWPKSCPIRTVVVVPEGAPGTPGWAKRIEKSR